MAPDEPTKPYQPGGRVPEGRKLTRMELMQRTIREKIARREAQEEAKMLEEAIALR